MQIYAFDELGMEQTAHFAKKNKKYFCIECRSAVSLRGGPFVRTHFYHLSKDRPCRVQSKTPTHLEVQNKLINLLPVGEARMEKSFSEINRIADVVWEKEKLIFEIQVSFISIEEIQARNRDYKKLGFQVIWILHESRFNRRRMTAAEVGLLNLPHYFTDMNELGIGSFYDQFSYHHKGKRILRLFKRHIALNQPLKFANPFNPNLPSHLFQSRQHWGIYFKGDIWTSTKPFLEKHLEQARFIEKKLLPETFVMRVKRKMVRWVKFIGYVLLDLGVDQ